MAIDAWFKKAITARREVFDQFLADVKVRADELAAEGMSPIQARGYADAEIVPRYIKKHMFIKMYAPAFIEAKRVNKLKKQQKKAQEAADAILQQQKFDALEAENAQLKSRTPRQVVVHEQPAKDEAIRASAKKERDEANKLVALKPSWERLVPAGAFEGKTCDELEACRWALSNLCVEGITYKHAPGPIAWSAYRAGKIAQERREDDKFFKECLAAIQKNKDKDKDEKVARGNERSMLAQCEAVKKALPEEAEVAA